MKKNLKEKIYGALFTILFILALAGQGSTPLKYYVSNSIGDDTRSATTAQNQSTPWKTIQHAHDVASLGTFGTEIHVAAGNYSAGTGGTALSCQGNNSLLCVSRGGSSTTIRVAFICDTQWSVPSSAGCILRSGSAGSGIGVIANNVDIVGFDYGSNANATIGILVGCYPANATCPTGNSVHIFNNYLHDIAQTANDGGPGGTGCPSEGMILVNQHHGSNVTDSQVMANRISNYGNQALKGATGINQCHGIYVDASNNKIFSNVVMDIVAYGIHNYSAPCNTMISGNTVVRVGQAGIIVAGGDCSPQGIITISNNIIDNVLHGGIQLGTGGGTPPCDSTHLILITNNLGSGNGSGNVTQANSCVQTQVNGASSPQQLSETPANTFVGYVGNSNDNLQIKSTSIANHGGTGNCVSGQANCKAVTDANGNPVGTPPPIGAYTIASVGPPLPPTGVTVVIH